MDSDVFISNNLVKYLQFCKLNDLEEVKLFVFTKIDTLKGIIQNEILD